MNLSDKVERIKKREKLARILSGSCLVKMIFYTGITFYGFDTMEPHDGKIVNEMLFFVGLGGAYGSVAMHDYFKDLSMQIRRDYSAYFDKDKSN